METLRALKWASSWLRDIFVNFGAPIIFSRIGETMHFKFRMQIILTLSH